MDTNNLWSGYDLNSKKQNTRCLAVNTILEGKYLVGPVLGQGGFGITYVGYDLNMEAKIAIKEYFPVELVSRDTTTMHGDRVLSLSGEKSVTYKQGLNKYVAEAQNVSQFSEIPGVVSVKDFFYANETAYIVMEFIDGISLKDYMKEKGGRLSEEETLKIMKPVLEALVQVHKSGIVHRDISPDNIMLTFEGSGHGKIKSVKMIDFGAARMTAKNDQKSLTIILKHGYAPEEQYRTHGEQGPWTDVYALSAVLYRMLTGEAPVPAMDRMFQDELKTFDKFNTKVSANTAAAILKGLAVKKDDRIQSVQELIAALYEGRKVAKTAGKQKKNWTAVAACGGIAVVLAIGGITHLGRGGSAESQISQSETVVEANGTEMQETINFGDSTQMVEIDMDQTEDAIGEQIAFYSPMNSISVSETATLICMPDGTVKARGANESRQCDVEEWNHVVAVKTSNFHSLGLRSDGTVYSAGENRMGECDVEFWNNVVAIETSVDLSLGITNEGNVLVAGQARDMIDLTKIASWTDIKIIESDSERVVGLKKDGSLVWEGEISIPDQSFNWENVETLQFEGNILLGIEGDGTVHAIALDSNGGEGMQSILDYYNSLPKLRSRIIGDYVSGSLGVSADGEVIIVSSDDPYFYKEELYAIENEEMFTSKMFAVSQDMNGYIYGITESGELIEYYMNSYGNCELEDFENLQNLFFIRSVRNYGPGILGQTTDGKLLYYGNEMDVREFCDQKTIQKEIMQYETNRNGIYVFVLEDGTTVSNMGQYPKDGVKSVAYDYKLKLMAFLMDDGHVELQLGEEEMSQSDVPQELAADWSNMKEIWQFNNSVYGLCEDGTILQMGCEEQEEPIEYSDENELFINDLNFVELNKDKTIKILAMNSGNNDSGEFQIEGWTDIVDLKFGETHTVGLKKDGTVVAVGKNQCGQCDVEEWTDVVAIDADGQCTIGLTKDGKMLMAGLLIK